MATNSKDIFSQLKDEHQQVKKLLQETDDCAPKDRKDMLEKIEQELVPHARGEEKTIYAVLRNRANAENDSDDLMDLTEQAYDEHKTVDDLMAELKEKDPFDMAWKNQFRLIKRNLEEHISQEEGTFFERAKSVLNDDELSEIHQAYNQAKDKFSEELPQQSEISERTPVEPLKKVTNL